MRNKGFTLVELLVVMAIIVLLLALGVGAIRGNRQKSQMNKGAALVHQVLREARMRAITDSVPCHVLVNEKSLMLTWKVRYSSATQPPGTVWDEQDRLWVKAELNNYPLPEGTRLTTNAPKFKVDPDGTVLETVVIQVRPDSGSDVITISMSPTGKVSQ